MRTGLALALLFISPALWAAGVPALATSPATGGGLNYSVSVQTVLLMSALTMLPALLLALTSFTRISIVLGLLRQALGTGQTPSNSVLMGVALLLSFLVMSPILSRINTEALAPYSAGTINAEQAMQRAEVPMRAFMLAQTRDTDLLAFANLSGKSQGYATPEEIPFAVLASAFLSSELTTAFQIGFLLFVPFVVIDLVVSSVLTSLGMMMLSPMLISLPFKLMLFVLVDGWTLVLTMLVASFKVAA